MLKLPVFFAVFLLTALTISCKDKTDTTAPEATVQSPSNDDEYVIGETIKLVADFSDNKELKSCKASISYSGDGSGEGSPWAPSATTISLSGSSQSVDKDLFGGSIPVCKTGDYAITLEISDAAETPNIKTMKIDIRIASNAPVLTVEKPQEGASFVAGIDFMTLTATCTDNKELKELVCSVVYTDNPGNVLKGATGVNDPWEPQSFKIPLTGTSKSFTDEPLFGGQIPESLAGNYKLILKLYDNEDNVTTKEINFILTN